ncbi:ankyrin repeat protein [Ancylostoma duodenale]|uniref:Ankyrin repeat protein n=1 Tax=Ancylostoma duodenale TaxID=51022 RepID=A0A0C2FM64_9BILA|nr:ankyrin repeat protein [Ancylostoma duodenale]
MYLQGANLNMTDYDGRTALHIAASEGHVELLKFFLSVAQVNHSPRDRSAKFPKFILTKRNGRKCRWGRTPLDEARQFDKLECAQLLENHRPEQKRQPGVDEIDEGSDSETTMCVELTAWRKKQYVIILLHLLKSMIERIQLHLRLLAKLFGDCNRIRGR